jgi:dihydrolipoamide dehydrogenase
MSLYDLIIIGGGPGGYVGAIRAAQLGLKTALVEKDKLGGMCLNWGCVPSRRLMESARVFQHVRTAADFGVDGFDANAVKFHWKKALTEKDKIVTKLVKGVEFLLKKNKVHVISGEASVHDGKRVMINNQPNEAKFIMIATGSRPDKTPLAKLPPDSLAEIDDIYQWNDLPESMVVAGGDTVACEMASLLSIIGKNVTMVAPEAKLMGWLDESLSKFITDKLRKSGVTIHLNAQISGGDAHRVEFNNHSITCDLVLNCSRRTAMLPPLESTPLDLEKGFIAVNEFYQTSVPSIYAVGDVTGSIFAHVASAQAVCAVNHMLGLKEPVNKKLTPITLFTNPEIGAVGSTEEELIAAGTEYIKGEFPLSVNSKAIVEGNTEGFVKILAEPKYGEILGVHVVASRATELISEAVMCMRTEGTLDDLTRVIHAHPTVSETVLEAGYKAAGKPLHI